VKNHRRAMIRNIRRLVVHGVVFSKTTDLVDRVHKLVISALANANGIAYIDLLYFALQVR